MNEPRWFEDVWPGDEYVEEVTRSRDDVLEYMRLVDMSALPISGIFHDEAVSRRAGFARPIVPGNMTRALLIRLVTDWMGTLGRLRTVEVSFRRPVQHGDRLRAAALVTDASDESGVPLVSLDLYLENERGERPVQGTATVELPRRGR